MAICKVIFTTIGLLSKLSQGITGVTEKQFNRFGFDLKEFTIRLKHRTHTHTHIVIKRLKDMSHVFFLKFLPFNFRIKHSIKLLLAVFHFQVLVPGLTNILVSTQSSLLCPSGYLTFLLGSARTFRIGNLVEDHCQCYLRSENYFRVPIRLAMSVYGLLTLFSTHWQ